MCRWMREFERIRPIVRRICACALRANRAAPMPIPARAEMRRDNTAVSSSPLYAHRAMMSPTRRNASMMLVDFVAGGARPKSAAATEVRPGAASLARLPRVAARTRTFHVSAVNVDRSIDAFVVRTATEGWKRTSRFHPSCVAREVEEPREAAH